MSTADAKFSKQFGDLVLLFTKIQSLSSSIIRDGFYAFSFGRPRFKLFLTYAKHQEALAMVTLAEPQIVQSTEYQQSWVVRFWKQPLVNIHMQFVDASS
jgi:hypothetical protein